MRKKHLLIINEVCGHTSTGKICADIADECAKKGWRVRVAYGRDNFVPEQYKKYAVRITSDFDVKESAVESRVLDNAGFSNKRNTASFLKYVEKFKPDLIWMHNLHGYYINVEILFNWLRKHPEIEKRWTLHDCWAFTGHCVYFTMARCNKWKTQCSRCPQRETYPKSVLIDNSYNNFKRKKAAFTGIKNLTIITPSKWLASLVKESFLKDYPVEVHYNTIDNSVFKPSPSSFKQKNNLEGKHIILGVANIWDKRKGLPDFYSLANDLGREYCVVLVGLSDKQIQETAHYKNIIGIKKTKDQQELAEIYTAADVLFNPTYEDNYPTVNLEAEACGTPVVTYRTGGSPESVPEENVVDVGDVTAARRRIEAICGEKSKKKNDIIKILYVNGGDG